MRRLAVAAGSALLVACVGGPPVVEQQAPELVLDVTNVRDEDVVVGWDFGSTDAQRGMSGTGETFAPACRRETLPVSTISGDYAITVDGKTVFEGTVPQRAGSETFLVIGLRIGPGGEVEVTAPGVALQAPKVSTALPGCG